MPEAGGVFRPFCVVRVFGELEASAGGLVGGRSGAVRGFGLARFGETHFVVLAGAIAAGECKLGFGDDLSKVVYAEWREILQCVHFKSCA